MITFPLAPERAARLLLLATTLVQRRRVLGDFEGHPFRGNQWTTGSGTHDEDSTYKGNQWTEEYAKRPFIRYHGTVSEALASIREKGLVPHGGKGADEWARQNWPDALEDFDVAELIDQMRRAGLPNQREDAGRKHSVYMTSILEDAKRYSKHAEEVNPGTKGIILAVDVPPDIAAQRIFEDTSDPDAVRYTGVVPPAWIKVVGEDGSLRALEGARRYYVVVLANEEKERTLGDFEGHPFRGNQWTEGSFN